ncbi:MAG TPA: ABC transporter substrate-binding protein, partial [Candidatus Nocardiopsis merdipullorum]|nr:ABC transporter substrate-binding protein [Candidatus Nocardiopsis merdipullorum]
MTFISQRSRTPWVGAMLTTLALLFAVGCAGTSDEEQRLRVALHFNSPQTSWVGIYVAQEKGYYEEAGLDLEFQYLGGS